MTAQINSQLAPRRVRGLGAAGPGGIPDFSTLISAVPSAATSWGQVNAQITAEGGGGGGVLQAAQSNFYQTWMQLSQQQPSATSGDLSKISGAAGSLLMNTSTIAGAVQNVEGLIQGATSGNSAEVVQALTGTMVSGLGLAIGAGAVSFGVGAAIVAGLEIAEAVFGQLFNQAQPVATLCNAGLNFSYNIAIGCVCSTGQVVKGGPGTGGATNPYWRRFPEPSNPADAWWFQPVSSFTWSSKWTSGQSSDQWYAIVTNGALGSQLRPIDLAFPQYHQLECDMNAASFAASLPDGGGTLAAPFSTIAALQGLPQSYSANDVALAKFMQAYFAGWKAAQEYAINGIPPSPSANLDDASVLAQVVSFWNTSRQTDQTVTIQRRNTSQNAYKTDPVPFPQTCQGTLGNEYFYVQMLLPYVAANLQSALPLSGGSLVINSGSKIAVPLAPGTVRVLPIGPRAKAPVKASSSMSATTVVAGTAAALAAGALAAVLYARHKHVPVKTVLRSTWNKTGGRIHVPHHLPKIKLPKSLRRSR